MSDTYIIAIGSSAGGSEPLNKFFDHTPHDQSAYFILRHFLFSYQSVLKEILSRHSDLVIVEAQDGQEVKKNYVYTLPPKMFMALKKGRIQLIPRDRLEKINRAFDTFLASLVTDKTSNVIVVILSGEGKDGSAGLTGIKEIGGIIIAQKLDTCESASMPENAIRTGLVNYIVAPEDMPTLIHQHIVPTILN